ncbi:hypothetical protein GYA54_02385 [Candidatus Kuenenbacteria bacterium]|nr:hypothetical protein [Candidatus Kuenenbacteria bacterium]
MNKFYEILEKFWSDLISTFIVHGVFEMGGDGKIKGFNPELRKKIAPSFLGLNQTDEIIAGQVIASLDTGERTIWTRWLSKLKKHQVTQLRILLAGTYHAFEPGMENAKNLAHSLVNIENDDDDSIKTKLALETGLITEEFFLDTAKNFVLDRIWGKLKDHHAKAQKAIDELVDDWEKKINNPLEAILSALK